MTTDGKGDGEPIAFSLSNCIFSISHFDTAHFPIHLITLDGLEIDGRRLLL